MLTEECQSPALHPLLVRITARIPLLLMGIMEITEIMGILGTTGIMATTGATALVTLEVVVNSLPL